MEETQLENSEALIVDGRTGQQRMRHFVTILGFQVISTFGSALTSFALGVWAFQSSGSFTAYAMIVFATSFSLFATAPFAGALVDRWPKKRVLLFSALGSALISLIVAILFWFDLLQIWQIFLLTLINGAVIAFSKPAIVTSIKMLIDSDDLGRANGMMAAGFGIVSLVAPAIAGFIMVGYGLQAVLLIDLATFCVGIIALSRLRLPARELAPSEPILDGVKFAWQYLNEKPALLWLIWFYATINFFVGIIVVLLQPMVLSLTDAAGLGIVMTISGLGYVAGALIMGVWGGPERKVLLIYVVALVMAIGMTFVPMYTEIWVLSMGAFVLSAGIPMVLTSNIVIIQKKVATSVIGRVDGLGTLITGFCLPMGYLVAGPVAQGIFEPLMQVPSESLNVVQSTYGLGKGRGVALMISLSSVILVMIVLAAMLMPKIRRIELDLPDEE